VKFQFRRAAIADIAAIRTWLREERSLGAEQRFVSALDGALDRLHDFPELGTTRSAGVRLLVVPRSTYQIVYSLSPDRLVVLRVAHTSRKPGFWLERD